MKRGGFIRRKPKAERSAYANRDRDLTRMAWVKRQRCAVALMYPGSLTQFPCSGVVEADHAGRRGLGQKAADDTCIPLCTGHHRQRHDCRGFFASWERGKLRAFLDGVIAACQQSYQEEIDAPSD